MRYTKEDLENLGFSLAEDPDGQYWILKHNEPVEFKLLETGGTYKLRVYIGNQRYMDYELLLRTLLGGNNNG